MQYRPLDLSPLANTPAQVLQHPETLQLGAVQKFGIPFSIGREGDPARTFLSIGPASPEAEAAVAERAKWLIFAHALADTALFEGGELGLPVATYSVLYEDGTAAQLPVRERFEIAASPQDRLDRPIPLDWGQNPFIAVPELEHVVPHRTHGRFDHAGGRTKEVLDPSTRLPYTLPYRWFLWAWRNPHPDTRIAALRFSALTEATVIVAGVTLSSLEEDPFDRTTNRDVLIELPFSAQKDEIEQLVVRIDRGTASFPYWIVAHQDDLEERPLLPAFGQTWRSHVRRTAHVRLTGTPSATVEVTFDDRLIARCSWGELVERGSLEIDGTRFSVVNENRTWVRTNVTDADTGALLPCRIHLRSANGVPYPPHGHPAHINGELATFAFDLGGDVRLGNKSYAYIDGECEGWLPVGEVIVEVARGFEYEPISQRITIEPDQSELALQLRRVSRVSDLGYVSGDTHGHFVSARGAEFEGAGEDLDIVNLQRTQGGELFTITEEVRSHPMRSGGSWPIVFVGQENRTGMFGHLNLLGNRRPVMPISTGGPDESEIGTGLETTLSHWADETRAQGGAAILAHFPVPNGEAATLIATQRIDGLEMIAYDEYNVREYYRYLDDGYRVPLVGGSDKMTADVPLGIIRTYAGGLDGDRFEYHDWLDAVRSGDTFVSSGPLLLLTVEGARPGTTLTRATAKSLSARVRWHSIFPMDRLEIVGTGGVLASVDLEGRSGAGEQEFELRLAGEASWIAARAFARGVTGGRHHDIYERPVAAHTSPVYVTAGEEYLLRSEATQRYMATLIEGAIAYIERGSRRFWPGSVHHRHGEAEHLEYLLRPFREALKVVRSRGETC